MPILLLFLLLFPVPLLAAPDQFSFAASLQAEQDYYRAITEYKRFLHYHPEAPQAAAAQLEIARCLYAGQRWPQGDAAAEQVWHRHPDSAEAREARRLYARSAFDRGDYQLARQRYRQLQQNVPAEAEHAELQIGRSRLLEGDPDAAQQNFARLPKPQQEKLQQLLDDYRALPRKSPHLAGTLSALLPGAGQLYTERPKQAGIALALNAAFIYGAIEAWNNENYTVAGLLSLFEIGWYGGNIYNASNNAHKLNRAREQRLLQRLQETGLSLGWRGSSPWLQAQINF